MYKMLFQAFQDILNPRWNKFVGIRFNLRTFLKLWPIKLGRSQSRIKFLPIKIMRKTDCKYSKAAGSRCTLKKICVQFDLRYHALHIKPHKLFTINLLFIYHKRLNGPRHYNLGKMFSFKKIFPRILSWPLMFCLWFIVGAWNS
jgi:hypothetical protein